MQTVSVCARLHHPSPADASLVSQAGQLSLAVTTALAVLATSASAVSAQMTAAPSPAAAAQRQGGAALHLVMVDLSGVPRDLASGALGEIRELLRPLGVDVTGEVSPPRERAAGDGAWVVFLPFDSSRERTQTTGGVARSEYNGTLTVWAFPPKVAKTLGVDLERFGRWSNRDRQEFHRALAVVIVHELAHALAGATHRPRGLMSAGLNRRSLLDPALALDPDLHQAFRDGVARLAAAPPLNQGSGGFPQPVKATGSSL